MKKFFTIFLQAAIIVAGIGILAFMLWEPHLEGRNAGATLFEIYFKDPFLAYAYASSVAFFAALYQAVRALGYVRENKTFSQEMKKALGIIYACMAAFLVLILGGLAYLVAFNRGQDDITGGVFMGLLAIAGSGTVAAVADRFRKKIYGDHN
jgi:hypothetical protein